MVAIMGTSTCHVMVGERARRDPRHVRRRRRRHRARALGLRGRPERRRRHLRLVRRERRAARPTTSEARARGVGVHEHLSALGAAQPVGEHGLVALDWWSGNRSVLVDHELTGVLVGMTLATRPHEIYRALVEATAFGARTIVDAFDAAGVPVRGVRRRRRPAAQRAADAVLRRRARHADQRDRRRAGPGARLGDARRGRRRACTPTSTRRRARWAAAAAGAYQPDPERHRRLR